jgi:hypothetical protein
MCDRSIFRTAMVPIMRLVGVLLPEYRFNWLN